MITFRQVENLGSELGDPTEDALGLLYQEITDEPPPPPGSTYKRSGREVSSWQEIMTLSEDELGRVESAFPEYNRYVQDEDWQAQVHRGRWPTTQGVSRDKETAVLQLYETYVQRLLKK